MRCQKTSKASPISRVGFGLAFVVSLWLLGPSARADELDPPKIPIAGAMRACQARVYGATGGYYGWSACLCGTAAPAFPSDKFYEDDLEDPQRACGLVQELWNAFSGVCSLYVRQEYENLEGKGDGPVNYSSYDFPLHYPITTTVISTPGGAAEYSYALAFAEIKGYIQKLHAVQLGLGMSEPGCLYGITHNWGSVDPDYYYACLTNLSPTCDEAIACARWNWDGWGGWDTLYPRPGFYVGSDVRTSLRYDSGLDRWVGSAYVEAGRCRLTADLTKYRGHGTVYLMKSPTGHDLYNYPVASTVTLPGVDGKWHGFGGVSGGGVYTSGFVGGDFDVSGCDNQTRYWCLINRTIIFWPEFHEEEDSRQCGDDCTGDCAPGSGDGGAGSLDYKFALGKGAEGKSAGYLYIHENRPGTDLATPARLSASVGPGVQVYRVGSRITGVVSQQTTVEIAADNVSCYTIKFKKISPAVEFKRFTIENPADNATVDYSSLRITEAKVEDGVVQTLLVNTFQYDNATNTWALTKADDQTAFRTEVSQEVLQPDNITTVKTFEVLNADNTSAYREVTTYRKYPWGTEIIAQAVGSPGQEENTTYEFDDNETSDAYSRLVRSTRPNGEQTIYAYAVDRVDNLTILAGTVVTTGDRVIATAWQQATYGTNGYEKTTTTTEYLSGQTVSCHQNVYRYGGDQDPNATTQELLDIRYNADNSTRVTRTLQIVGEWNNGKPLSVTNPDGTLTVYEYADSCTTRVWTGHTSDNVSVDNGTWTETVVNLMGGMISTTTRDIVTDQILASETAAEWDEFGRPTRVTYLDGTSTATVYGCCGPTTTTDRDGITTSYTYDAVKRVTSTTRAGITESYEYDALGRVVREYRNGTLMKTSTYDAAGRLTLTTDGRNQTTSFSETIDTSGHTIRTTTYPDNATRIEDYYSDGQLSRVTGSAVHGVQYEYGADAEGPYTLEVKLAADNQPTSEWTKRYTNFLGQTTKVICPNNAVALSCYNALGQLVRQVDPDNVTTLYAYNGQGQLETTAVDMDGSGAIELAGSDRATTTTSTIANTGHGWARVAETKVYPNEGSAAAVTTLRTETSLNGLQTWTYTNGQTAGTHSVYNPTTHTRTVLNPDNTSMITSANDKGLVTSVVRKDGTGTVLEETTTTYDNLNRVSVVLLTQGSRTKTTTYTYAPDNATDQPASVRMSAPGVPDQVTSYVYDTMGRLIEVTNPDGRVVHTAYYLTGEVQKTYGAKAYPVSYAYDYAGRMATMTTYKGFDNATGDGSGESATTTWTYDPSRGYLRRKTYADNHYVEYTYTPGGKLQTRTWARGAVTTYGYNSAGDLASVIYSDDNTTETDFFYDRLGRRTRIDDAAGTRYLQYDTVTSQADNETMVGGGLFATHQIVSYGHDSLGRRTGGSVNVPVFGADFNGDGHVDFADFAIQQAHYGQSVAAWTNGDANGDGQVTFEDFSVLQNTYHHILDQPGPVEYAYDAAGRIGSVTHRRADNGTLTDGVEYGYLAGSTLVDNITFSHDGAFRLATGKTYDGLDRLTEVVSQPSADEAVSYSYTYNAANQRTSMTMADNSTWGYGYDLLGQLTAANRSFADSVAVPGQQFTYTYDGIGNRISAGVTGTTTRTDTYTTNNVNQYQQRTAPPAVDVMGYTDLAGSLTVTKANEGYSAFRHGDYYQAEARFDKDTRPAYLPVQLRTEADPSVSVIIDDNSSDVEYDGEWYEDTGGHGGSFHHDNATNKDFFTCVRYWAVLPQAGMYRVSMWWPTDAANSSDVRVLIEHAGKSALQTVNQQQPGDQWHDLGTYNFTANDGTENYIFFITYMTTGRVVADAVKFDLVGPPVKETNVFVPASPEVFAYDDDGNLTQDGRWKYTWDAENRLTEIEALPNIPAAIKVKLKFTYDYLGRRIRKEVYGWNSAGKAYSPTPQTVLKFIYDGWNLVAELDGRDNQVRSYVWGPDLSGALQGAGGIGGLLLVNQAGTAYYPCCDGNGNVTRMVNADKGTVVAEYEYGPYGQVLISRGEYAEANPFRFSTKYTDIDTGLVYFSFRYYSPDKQRWINSDPAGENGGSNLYAYARNDPVRRIDPFGKAPCTTDRLTTCCWLCSRFGGGRSGWSRWEPIPREVQYPSKNAERGCKCRLKGELGTFNNLGEKTETKLAEAYKGKCCACTIRVSAVYSWGIDWHAVLEISCPRDNGGYLVIDKYPTHDSLSDFVTAYIRFRTQNLFETNVTHSSTTISCKAAERLRNLLSAKYPSSASHIDPPDGSYSNLDWEGYLYPVYACREFADRWFNIGLSTMCGD